ncbi:hypothetical protein MUK42_35984 [Musa troglodytarum]|uniref:Uncharacterized protein n=1 Tax=Musa troglodytarum TaxID=320322 RepID=A0A9E7FBB0_9LILI|nr:hypothetical protein MUK42_35984 [Musa troglodytarum]
MEQAGIIQALPITPTKERESQRGKMSTDASISPQGPASSSRCTRSQAVPRLDHIRVARPRERDRRHGRGLAQGPLLVPEVEDDIRQLRALGRHPVLLPVQAAVGVVARRVQEDQGVGVQARGGLLLELGQRGEAAPGPPNFVRSGSLWFHERDH